MKSAAEPFTLKEAESKLQQKVVTTIEFAGVWIYTPGVVIGIQKLDGKNGYMVLVKWDHSRGRPKDAKPIDFYTKISRFQKNGYRETLREVSSWRSMRSIWARFRG